MVPLLAKLGTPLVGAFIVTEALVGRLRGEKLYEKRDTLANLGIAFVNNLVATFVWTGLAVAAYTWASAHAPWHVPMTTWWSWALALLVADFLWYCEHRAGHRVRALWAVHSVHHSSEEYNYSIALRLPWLGGLTRIPFLMPMAFVGFAPAQVLFAFSVVLMYQIWVHTKLVKRIGWLEAVLMTPSHHRAHHAVNALYIDKNYGGILILWDRLFGTFVAESETPRFGVTKPIGTHNPAMINAHELVAIVRDLRSARTWGERFGYLFRGPEWHPAAIGTAETHVGVEPAAPAQSAQA
jgi:sterol desaturase/sphingolipid hydroxylase (fatty acid hydroxylase superfamily)